MSSFAPSPPPSLPPISTLLRMFTDAPEPPSISGQSASNESGLGDNHGGEGREIMVQKQTSPSEEGSPLVAKRKYPCTHPGCTKSFTTSGHLSRHNRIHTGEKNFHCPVPGCQSRFSRQDNMMQHYRTHLNSKSKRLNSNNLLFPLISAPEWQLYHQQMGYNYPPPPTTILPGSLIPNAPSSKSVLKKSPRLLPPVSRTNNRNYSLNISTCSYSASSSSSSSNNNNNNNNLNKITTVGEHWYFPAPTLPFLMTPPLSKQPFTPITYDSLSSASTSCTNQSSYSCTSSPMEITSSDQKGDANNEESGEFFQAFTLPIGALLPAPFAAPMLKDPPASTGKKKFFVE